MDFAFKFGTIIVATFRIGTGPPSFITYKLHTLIICAYPEQQIFFFLISKGFTLGGCTLCCGVRLFTQCLLS